MHYDEIKDLKIEGGTERVGIDKTIGYQAEKCGELI